MKKNYISPELEITEVALVEMIANSIVVDPNNAADPEYEGGGDAKRVDFSDDDFEF